MESFACLVIWLILGGLAMGLSLPGTKKDDIVILFFGCLLLAPFAFGASLLEIRKQLQPPETPKHEPPSPPSF